MLGLPPTVVRCLLVFAAVLIALMVADTGAGAHSRTGGRIAFAVGESGVPRPSQLGVMDADGKHRRMLPPFDVHSGSWSPDGRSIAYGRTFGFAASIWTTNVNGGPAHRIVRNGDSPDWSPDGKSIAFEHRGGIWALDLNDGRQRRIVRHGHSPRWSPDGRKLVFERGRPRTDLWVLDVATKEERLLVGRGRSADWSPRGGEIVFDRCRARCFVYIVRADGTAQRRLFEGVEPRWSPTGQEIAFVGRDPRLQYYDTIIRARLDGSGRRVLFGEVSCVLLDWGQRGRRRR